MFLEDRDLTFRHSADGETMRLTIATEGISRIELVGGTHPTGLLRLAVHDLDVPSTAHQVRLGDVHLWPPEIEVLTDWLIAYRAARGGSR